MAVATVHSDHAVFKLSSELRTQQLTGVFVNLTLAFNCGTTCSVHHCVVAAMSRYMKMRINSMDSLDKCLVISELSYYEFEPLLNFMYSGTCSVENDIIEKVRAGSEMLELDLLTEQLQLKVKTEMIPLEDNTSTRLEDAPSICAPFEIHDIPQLFTEITALPTRKVSKRARSKKQTEIKQPRTKRKKQTVSAENNAQISHVTDQNIAVDFSMTPYDERDERDPDFTPSFNATEKEEELVTRITRKRKSILPRKLNMINESEEIKERSGSSQSTSIVKQEPEIINEKQLSERDQIKLLTPSIKCPHCPYAFYHITSLKRHLKSHTVKSMGFTLENSIGKARLAQSISRLLIKKKSSGKTSIQCKICQSQFKSHVTYNHHVRKNHSKRYKCKHCSQSFTSLKLLHIHTENTAQCRTNHDKCTRIYCQYCNSTFLHDRIYRSHLATSHSGIVSESTSDIDYRCNVCSKTLPTRELFAIHMTGHNLSKEHYCQDMCVALFARNVPCLPCKDCNRQFRNRKKLNEHRKSKHNWERPKRPKVRFVCKEEGCNGVFVELAAIRRHVKKCHPGVMHNCPKCHYTSIVKESVERHLKIIHMGLTRHCCQVCNKPFSLAVQKRRHEHRYHGLMDDILKIHSCTRCTYTGYSIQMIRAHMKTHEDEKRFPCPICNKTFKEEKSIKEHIVRLHEKNRRFVCETCGKSYGDVNSLRIHALDHTGLFAHHCHMCDDYKTNKKEYLKNHLYQKHKIKTGRYLNMRQCEMCGFETYKRNTFQDHMNRHAGIKGHHCTHCTNTFYTRSELNNHVSWKHRENEYRCTLCTFTTPLRCRLKTHTELVHTHPNMKPYKCFYCDFRCNLSGNCNKHIKQKHKDLPVKWVKVVDEIPAPNSKT